MTAQFPPAQGVRLQWPELPGRIRSAIESRLASSVIEAVSQPFGFSPGMAARIRTEDSRRVFIKAVGPDLNPDSPMIFRIEAAVTASLPRHAPVPELLWSLDEDADGWVVLAFEDVDGWNPAVPWRADELARVVDALVQLSVSLTPSPIDVSSASDVFGTQICGWQELRHDTPEGLDAWSLRNLDRLADYEEAAPIAVAGNTLLHLDVRADNILLTPDRVVVVDWPSAAVGAAWLDVVTFAPSVAMQGGPRPEALLRRHPAARDANPENVTAAIAAVAGYFTHRSLQSAPPGLPTLRAFQAAQGVVARQWLAERTGL